MTKIYILIIISFFCFVGSAQAYIPKSVENLEIVVCDGCDIQKYKTTVLNASTINNKVIVMDAVNRRVLAFYREIESERERAIYVYDDVVPYEHLVSFNEYMQIYDLIEGGYKTIKTWNYIPKELSSQGVANATATIQGIPFPIPPTLCTSFCVDTKSVHSIFENLDAQRLIGLELNKAYTATVAMKFKIVLHKMLVRRAFIITVGFSDNTKVDFRLDSPELTIPWAMLPDTALDSHGKLIRPPLQTKHQFNGGFGEGNYRSDRTLSGGFTLRSKCVTAYTGSYPKLVSQLVCFLVP